MIYLIRHGETDWNKERIIQGHTDIPLNKNGILQAKNLSKKINNISFDHIYSSDLLRAKQTASELNNKFNLPINYDDRLREVCYGKMEGIKINKLPDGVWNIFDNHPEELGAESKQHLFDRVKDFFENIDMSENILIVTHGGILRMIIYYLENIRKDYKEKLFNEKYLKLKIKNADVLIFNNGKIFNL